jgi:Na+/H+-translocating membrane pyrophosphatase
MLIPAMKIMPESAEIEFAGVNYDLTRYNLYACIAAGLWSGLLIGYITEYFTSNKY